MSLNVGYIPGSLRIDPDAAGQGNQRKRGERQTQKKDNGDSVSISDEARRLYSEGNEAEPDGAGQ